MNTAHVLIVGGGFAGLEAAKELDSLGISTVLVDKQNHHLFQPLLYQVACAGLAAPSIAAPLRHSLRGCKNVQVLQAEVTHIDAASKTVSFAHGDTQSFDAILLAAGAMTSYFGNNHWEKNAPGLKTLADAQKIRHAMLSAFEIAERETDVQKRDKALRFVLIGGGPTGVELAGSLAEIAHHTLPGEFRTIDTRQAHIMLLEGSPRVLAAMDEDLSAQAYKDLTDLGVDVRTQSRVLDIQEGSVRYRDAAGVEHTIECNTVVWAAGVGASPVIQSFTKDNNIKAGPGGRIPVLETLQVPDYPGVFAAGDCVAAQSDGKPVPGMAPAAKQMGRHAARNIAAMLRRQNQLPFVYDDNGSLATIGRHKAVVQLPKMKFSGYLAWTFWLFIHVFFLIGWRNRAAVMSDWAWSYWTKQRWARVIWRD